MKKMFVWIFMLLTPCLHYASGLDGQRSHGSFSLEELAKLLQPEDYYPLFLTPYIENCTYELGRNKSRVALFQQLAQVSAYSGYITVNSTTKSHLFFLLVEAEGNASEAPLMLWTQGGPGLSALFGEFLQNGPVAFTGNPLPSIRQKTLQKNMSIIYLDLPVGAGFSFTEDNTTYPKTLEEITHTVIVFLDQFLQLFSYYNGRDLYLAGESYGARYSISIADWILKNENNLSLNLKGTIGGNGFLGPVLEVADSTEFLYQMSMLNSTGRELFGKQFADMRAMAATGNETLKLYALKTLLRTIFTSEQEPTLFQNLTLFNDHASPMLTNRPILMLMCYVFLNTNTTKMFLHAGADRPFQINNYLLLSSFAYDWMRDISSLIEHVLNRTNVLFYTGQMDALFPARNQQAFFKRLNWTFAEQFREATRSPWIPHEKYYGFAGYIKKVETFTEAVLLGMSHFGAFEKPDEVYDLITQFIANKSDIISAPITSTSDENLK